MVEHLVLSDRIVRLMVTGTLGIVRVLVLVVIMGYAIPLQSEVLLYHNMTVIIPLSPELPEILKVQPILPSTPGQWVRERSTLVIPMEIQTLRLLFRLAVLP